MKAHPLMTSAARTRAAKAAGEKEGVEGERDEVGHADTAGERPQGTKRMGGSLNEGESAALTKGGPVSSQLFNNRKCGNKKPCLQTQEDAWQEETGAEPRQETCSSLKLGARRENDTCKEGARRGRRL